MRLSVLALAALAGMASAQRDAPAAEPKPVRAFFGGVAAVALNRRDLLKKDARSGPGAGPGPPCKHGP